VIRAVIREMRPKQWLKNVLVFAAPGAAGVLDNPTPLWHAVVAFIAFSMAASGTYYWNDILDVESDRLHPVKCKRPIASGAVPLRLAKLIGTLLLVGGIALAALPRWETTLVLLAYVALTVSYSAIWKHIAVLDLIAVAGGFVLRAIGGAVAVDVPMSKWFVLTVTFASLFIVTGKRFAEMRSYGDKAARGRRILEDYSLEYLRTVLAISLGATMVTYCIWAFETKELSGITWPIYEVSVVPMIAALLRYQLVLDQGHGAAPEEIFVADRPLQLLGLAWVLVFGLGVYVS
jgi:decaprenyl-phosphate phosphoribosyltransferase